ncbi:hypothetical protein ABT026_00365 [Streptomyces sp. NPDC002734]|uniref:hypothetical protein n=1 Tax=Streptomyces sp. NPDC002734 TaxID=3154426 RepID=UPI00331B1CCE
MWRHEFQPGRCISGLVLVTAGVLYTGDAAGEWEVPWFVAIPLVAVGFFFAAVAGLTAHLIRGARRDAHGRRGPAADGGSSSDSDSGSGSGSAGDTGDGRGGGAHLAG